MMPAKNESDSRACLYLRKSTDEQEQSIGRQREQATAYATARGYRVVQEYVDEGIAGDVFDRRPDFQKMLAAAGRGEFEVIVVDEPSRLSRQNPIDLIEKVIAPLRRSRVRIDTASKGPLDYESLAGIIMMTVHAHKSEDESRDLSRRSFGGMVLRALAGKWFGWMAPFGLRVIREVNPDTGKVISRKCVLGPEEEVQAVRFIFDAVANRNWSLRQVCRELEARGVKPPAGNGRGKNKAEGRWNPGTVRKILINRKYLGDLTYNVNHQGKYSYFSGGKVEQHGVINRRSSRNLKEDVVIVPIPDLIPALIDRDTFTRAGAALALAQKRTGPDPDARYLFARLLVCGDCGSYLRGQPDHGRKGYICAKYKEYGSKACARNTVSEALLKESLLASLLDDILSPARLDEVEAEIEQRLKAERGSGEAERLHRQVAALDRDIAQGNANLARLPEDRLPGVIAQGRAWEGERAGLLARLNDLEHGHEQSKAVLAEARKQLWRLREALEGDDEEAQATVIREVVTRVEVRFGHEKTHGRRSATGQGRTLSKPVGAVLYVRPGLGLSCLVTSDCRNPPRGGASARARESGGRRNFLNANTAQCLRHCTNPTCPTESHGFFGLPCSFPCSKMQ
jgi:DNA invertase Pin-like site-specific DNA recombinase